MPEGWAWCRLSQIIILYSGQDLEPSRYNDNSIGIPYITGASNFEDGRIIINRWTDSPTTHATIDDLLLTCKGSGVGKMVWCNIENAHIARQIMALRCIDGLYKNYLEIVMLAFLSKIVSKANGLIPGLSRDVILNMTFPLPPFNEQTQIYHKSKEILSYTQQVDKETEKLIDIINITKSKILDLAIRGKLVPQNPNDEPASVLLERIRAEKEELIKQGKIKRDKKESIIFRGDDNSYYEKIGNDVTCIDDEISFDIPDTWSWTRISTITDITMGSSPKSQDICNDNQYIEFHQGKIYFSKKTLMKSNQYTRKTTKLAPKQSVLLCVRAPVGELNITDRDICIGRGLASIKSLGNINEEFIFYWLHPYKTYLVNQSTGSTFSAITSDTVRKILIPLPPLMEQKEILDKIQKVFTLFENLETVN